MNAVEKSAAVTALRMAEIWGSATPLAGGPGEGIARKGLGIDVPTLAAFRFNDGGDPALVAKIESSAGAMVGVVIQPLAGGAGRFVGSDQGFVKFTAVHRSQGFDAPLLVCVGRDLIVALKTWAAYPQKGAATVAMTPGVLASMHGVRAWPHGTRSLALSPFGAAAERAAQAMVRSRSFPPAVIWRPEHVDG